LTYRLGADAYDPSQIPAAYNARDRLVLGYDHWPAEAWARFPLARKVRIATNVTMTGAQYGVLDVEAGDAEVWQVPGWLTAQHRIGAKYPTIYIQESSLAGLRSACQGLAYDVWLAWWGHSARVPGTVGTQLGPVNGPDSYDASRFWAASWQPADPPAGHRTVTIGGPDASSDLFELAAQYHLSEDALIGLNPGLGRYAGSGKPVPVKTVIYVPNA
jgi:hypothetical protein